MPLLRESQIGQESHTEAGRADAGRPLRSPGAVPASTSQVGLWACACVCVYASAWACACDVRLAMTPLATHTTRPFTRPPGGLLVRVVQITCTL
jgi:hypothetical protein